MTKTLEERVIKLELSMQMVILLLAPQLFPEHSSTELIAYRPIAQKLLAKYMQEIISTITSDLDKLQEAI